MWKIRKLTCVIRLCCVRSLQNTKTPFKIILNILELKFHCWFTSVPFFIFYHLVKIILLVITVLRVSDKTHISINTKFFLIPEIQIIINIKKTVFFAMNDNRLSSFHKSPDVFFLYEKLFVFRCMFVWLRPWQQSWKHHHHLVYYSFSKGRACWYSTNTKSNEFSNTVLGSITGSR